MAAIARDTGQRARRITDRIPETDLRFKLVGRKCDGHPKTARHNSFKIDDLIGRVRHPAENS